MKSDAWNEGNSLTRFREHTKFCPIHGLYNYQDGEAEECPECEDEPGELLSVCCGVKPLGELDNGNPPSGLCSECHDNTTFTRD